MRNSIRGNECFKPLRSQMRERTGQIIENKERKIWIARVCYLNKNGKRTAIQRKATTKTEAKAILKQLLESLAKGGRDNLDTKKLTFGDLID